MVSGVSEGCVGSVGVVVIVFSAGAEIVSASGPVFPSDHGQAWPWLLREIIHAGKHWWASRQCHPDRGYPSGKWGVLQSLGCGWLWRRVSIELAILR